MDVGLGGVGSCFWFYVRCMEGEVVVLKLILFLLVLIRLFDVFVVEDILIIVYFVCILFVREGY